MKQVSRACESVSLPKLDRLDVIEMAIVRHIISLSQSRFLRGVSRITTQASNGWLYLAASSPILCWRQARWPIFTGLLSMALAFIPYLLIKPAVARLRPCDRDPTLCCGIRPLDKFSCPSGHCMSATAFGVPLAYSFHSATVVVVVSLLLISWARLALGHHYPTDLAVGLFIGLSVSIPISIVLL